MTHLRIGIVTTDYPPTRGGISTLTQSLSKYLSHTSEVDSVVVLAMRNSLATKEKINEKLSIVRATRKTFLGICFDTWKQMLNKRDVDVFHATTVFPIGFIVLLLGKYVLKKPVFVSYYGTDLLTNEGSQFTKWAKKWTVTHAAKSIALGMNTRTLVEKKFGLKQETSIIISYALPDNVTQSSELEKKRLRAEFRIEEDDFVILYVGNLIKRKGCHDLFDAVVGLKDERIKLIFIGTGPELECLEEKQKTLDVYSRIHFAGRRETLDSFYGIANVFCMPSYFDTASGDIEGLGIVFLEAAQHQVPSIGTYSGGIPDAIQDGVTGFLVPERNIEALKEKILYLKNNPDISKKMGIEAQKFVKEKFDWHKNIKKHIDLYKSFL